MTNPFEYPCEHCGFDLDGGDIYEVMKSHRPDLSEEKLHEEVSSFGWYPENKKRFYKYVGHVSLEEDRVTHYICPKCEKIVKPYWKRK
jgi:predicted RNA-binding Zn-ribbon protein involved in translation (DUF1610 family)